MVETDKGKRKARRGKKPAREEPDEPDESEMEGVDEKADDFEPVAEEEEKEPGVFKELYLKFFGESWDMWVGSVILAVLSILLFLIASPWGSSGGLVNWGQNMYSLFGLPFDESAGGSVTGVLDHRYAMLSALMLMGALASALMAKEFAVRVSPAGDMAKGFAGGILMGIGCVIGMGCTIGNFFSGWAAMSGGAIIFVIGLVIGVVLAVKYLLWEMMKHPGASSGRSYSFLQARSKGVSLQPAAGIIVVIIGMAMTLMYDRETQMVLILFVLFGLLIGMILQRSRWCVVRSLREMFLSGDAGPAKAIIAGLVVGLMGFTVIKFMGIGPETSMVAGNFWIPAIIGGIVFGFGMTIAGGCTVGSTWRAGEGHTKSWLALLGIIIAGPLTAEYILPRLLDVLPASTAQTVFLPDNFTYMGSFVIMLLILLMWYLFAVWNEKTGKFSAY